MTDERIKELRLNCEAPWSPAIYVVEECLDEIERLKGAAAIDDQRLLAAANAAHVLYVGCDTAEALADRIIEQAEHIRRLREALDKIVALCRSFDHGNCSSAELRLWVRNWASKASLLAETEPK